MSIDSLADDVVVKSTTVNDLGKAYNEQRTAITELLEKLINLDPAQNATELKHQCIMTSLALVDKANDVGLARRVLQEATSALIDAVKRSGRETITTTAGITLTMVPTLQLKLPQPPAGEEEGKDSK